MKPDASAINPAQAMGLPAVYVEKITLLPPDLAAGKQTVQVNLSLQVISRSAAAAQRASHKLLNGDYRVFAAFSRDPRLLMSLKTNPLQTKTMIKNLKINGEGRIIKHYLKPPPKTQRSMSITLGSDQKVVASKTLVLKQSFSLKALDNLYFYAVTYGSDPQSLMKNGVEGKMRALRVGVPTCETILTKGASPLQTAVFKLNQQDDRGDFLWPGPVHYNENQGYMVGAKHTNASHRSVSPLLVSNQKLQDLRFIEAANQLDFTLSDSAVQLVDSSLASTSAPAARRNNEAIKKIIQTPRYISDSTYSRMQDNSLKIFFSIDYGRLARENSTLGYLIQNPTALYNSYNIENIKIYRTRINANIEPNELTPGKVDICGSGQKKPNEEEKLVATLGSGVRTLGFSKLNGNVLALVATDATMANYNFGTYEYRVVIETSDFTTSAIKTLLNKLDINLKKYELFYDKMTGHGKSGAGIEQMSQAQAAEARNESPAWKELISSYLASVEFLFGDGAMTPSPSVWRKNLVAMANSGNRDLTSMLKVKEIVGDFVTNLRMLIDPPTQSASAGGSNVRSKIDSQNGATRKILLNHVFSSNYTSPGPSGTGTDYLDANLTERNGALVNVSYDNFINRVQIELSKFILPRPNDPGVNQFGFLTPVRINTEGSVVDTSTVDLASSQGNGILNASLDPNSSTRPPTSPNSSDAIYYSELNNILLSAGISVEQTTLPLGAVLKSRGKDININTLQSSQFLSSTSPFFKENTALETTLSGSNEVKMNIGKDITENVLESGIVGHLVNMRAINFIPPSDYTPPDNARGSLAAESAAQNPDSLDSNSTFGQSVNFNSVAEIQYFNGYTQTGAVINLNSPVWKTLTRQVYSAAKSQNIPLLCRISVMTPSLNMPNNYKLPLYDELFLLGASARAKSNLNVQGANYQSFFDSLLQNHTGLTGAILANKLTMTNPSYMHVPIETAINAPLETNSKGASTGGDY